MGIVIAIIVVAIIAFLLYRRFSWRKMPTGHGTDPGKVVDLPRKDSKVAESKADEGKKSGYIASSIPVQETKEKKEDTDIVIMHEGIKPNLNGKWFCVNCDTLNLSEFKQCCVCFKNRW